jgi:ABC-type Mn2+/Zn2+ transport system permease subunit
MDMFAGLFDFDWVPTIMTEWWFIAIMIVALLGLVGVLLVLRNRRTEEDD